MAMECDYLFALLDGLAAINSFILIYAFFGVFFGSDSGFIHG